MTIKLNITPVLAFYSGDRKSVMVDGDTVHECLEALVMLFPDLRDNIYSKDGKLAGFIAISLNNEILFPIDADKPVKDGDELKIEFQAE